MSTNYLAVYGASDDLVEFEGVFREEYNIYTPVVFMIRIDDHGDRADFILSAKFCRAGWRIGVETCTNLSNIPVEVEFTQREDSDGKDPMIVFHLNEGATVEVILL